MYLDCKFRVKNDKFYVVFREMLFKIFINDLIIVLEKVYANFYR